MFSRKLLGAVAVGALEPLPADRVEPVDRPAGPGAEFEDRPVLVAVGRPGVQVRPPGQEAPHHEAGDEGRALSELLDRLGQRLSLWRMEPTGSHWPEHAAVPVDAYAPVAVPAGWGERLRPVRLLDRPREMTVLAEAPDGPPAQLRLDGRMHRVRHAAGPEPRRPARRRPPAGRPPPRPAAPRAGPAPAGAPRRPCRSPRRRAATGSACRP